MELVEIPNEAGNAGKNGDGELGNNASGTVVLIGPLPVRRNYLPIVIRGVP